ncbi:hypothetical protein ABE27_01645 [Cytobacillus firmus]|nr:hypothetical protein [Cytobacillus firmus]
MNPLKTSPYRLNVSATARFTHICADHAKQELQKKHKKELILEILSYIGAKSRRKNGKLHSIHEQQKSRPKQFVWGGFF